MCLCVHMCKRKNLFIPPYMSSHSFQLFPSKETHIEEPLLPFLQLAHSSSLQYGRDTIPAYDLLHIRVCSMPQTFSYLFAALQWPHLAVTPLLRQSAIEFHLIIVHRLSASWILYKWAQCSTKPQVAKWAKQKRMTHTHSSCLVALWVKDQHSVHTHTWISTHTVSFTLISYQWCIFQQSVVASCRFNENCFSRIKGLGERTLYECSSPA